MKVLFVFVFFVLAISVFGQNKRDMARKYHKAINRAEMNICDGKYAKANRQYQKGLNFIEQPFSIDIYNSLLLKIKMDADSAEINNLLKILIKRGYKLKYLTKVLPIIDFPGVGKIDTFLFSYSVEKSPAVLKLDSFIQEDQRMRRLVMDSISIYYNIFGRDTLSHFDSINCRALVKYMEIDFPTEFSGKINSNPYSIPAYFIIFNHCNSWENYHPFDSLVNNKILSGEFSPEWYVHLYSERESLDTLNWKDLYGSPIDYLSVCEDPKKEEIKIWINYSKKELRVINRYRMKILLEKYQEYKKKSEFEFDNHFFHFTYNQRISFC